MSMCYLCQLCENNVEIRLWDMSLIRVCDVTKRKEHRSIDYGRDDPYEICPHFKPKDGDVK